MQNVFDGCFWKYQGGGNDFILIADWSNEFSLSNKEYIVWLCGRHYGIGADGLIVLRKSVVAHCYMYFFNCDGSSASMCGNGTRCVAQFLEDTGRLQEEDCLIEGPKGIINLYKKGQEFVSVLPIHSLNKYDSSLFLVDIGAVHAIQFFPLGISEDFLKYVQRIKRLPGLPKGGVNVSAVQPRKAGGFELSVFERGVEEETLSCATGVGAAAVVLSLYGLGNSFFIYTKGRDKFHAMVEEGVHVQGPAYRVFQGRVFSPSGQMSTHREQTTTRA